MGGSYVSDILYGVENDFKLYKMLTKLYQNEHMNIKTVQTQNLMLI